MSTAPPDQSGVDEPRFRDALRSLPGPVWIVSLGILVNRVGNFLPVMLGLWPVLALSGTLAGEAAKGSIDLLASTPHSRRSIALVARAIYNEPYIRVAMSSTITTEGGRLQSAAYRWRTSRGDGELCA